MKKFILSIVSFLLFVHVFAQKGDLKRPMSLGISFFVNDFISGTEIKNNGLSYGIRNGSLFKPKRFNAGAAVHYLKGLSSHVDFLGVLGGSYVDYPIPNKPPTARDAFLLEASGNLNVKLLPDNFWVVPFADFGLGVSKYLKNYGAFAPVGLGLQINLVDEFFITLNSQYRLPITDNTAPHVFHSLTFYSVIGKKK